MSGRTSVHTGRVVFGAMDEVVFGLPASEAIVEQLNRLGAKRAFLTVSGTLNRETDVIENIRRAMAAVRRARSMRCRRTHRAPRRSPPANRPAPR